MRKESVQSNKWTFENNDRKKGGEEKEAWEWDVVHKKDKKKNGFREEEVSKDTEELKKNGPEKKSQKRERRN